MNDLKEMIYDALESPQTRGDLFHQIPIDNTEIVTALQELEDEERILVVGFKSALRDPEDTKNPLAVGHFGGPVYFRFNPTQVIVVAERVKSELGYINVYQSYTMEEY